MKVAQTRLSESEYDLLVEYARKRNSTLKDVIREAVRSLILSDKVSPEDLLFVEPPSTSRSERRERTSGVHDKILYPGPKNYVRVSDLKGVLKSKVRVREIEKA